MPNLLRRRKDVMPLNFLAIILHDGREYRYLAQAEQSLRNRLRALLRALHGAMEDQRLHDTHILSVRPTPCSTPLPSTALQIQGAAMPFHQNGTAVPSILSQVGDLANTGTLSMSVPAWLSKPPKGMARAAWHPAQYLALSPAASILYSHAQSIGESVQFRRRQLEKAVHTLPIWQDWCAAIKGIDAYGLARLLCETGDLWRYPTVAKLWTRMGVGLYAGERQQRRAKVSQAEAMAIAYSPRRRAIVYNLQTGLLTQNKAPDGTPGVYRTCYLTRKVVEQAKAPALTKQIWHRRASRYMAKRFLRDLWVAWRHTMPRPADQNGTGAAGDQKGDVILGQHVSPVLEAVERTVMLT